MKLRRRNFRSLEVVAAQLFGFSGQHVVKKMPQWMFTGVLIMFSSDTRRHNFISYLLMDKFFILFSQLSVFLLLIHIVHSTLFHISLILQFVPNMST